MTLVTKSQLAVPLSQNTAPVFQFDCLYTHDLVRKQKRWQDGTLAFHTFNKRLMVYDLTNNFIGDTYWRESESIGVGDGLRLDRGVLVEVGEAKGLKDQDISEIFAKKTAPSRNQNSPLRETISTGLNGRKPKSISAVLGTGKSQIGRASVPRLPSSLSNWSSPIDVDAQRPPKRARLETIQPQRQVLAAKESVNQIVPPAPHGEKRTIAKAATKSTHAVPESSPDPWPSSKVAKQSKKKRAVEDSTSATKLNSATTSKTKTKVERRKRSKLTEPEPTGEQRPRKAQKMREISTNNGYAARKPDNPNSTEDLVATNRPKQILMASKARRKKLIFQSISTNDDDNQYTSRPISKESAGPKPDEQRNQEQMSLGTAHQDVILISSHPEDQQEFDISDDDDFYITPIHRRISSGRKSVSSCDNSGRSSTKIPNATNNIHIALEHDLSLFDTVQEVQDEIEDHSTFPGLLGDTTMLAAFADSPIQARVRNIAPDPGAPLADLPTAGNIHNDEGTRESPGLAMTEEMSKALDTASAEILLAVEWVPPSSPLLTTHSIPISPLLSNGKELDEECTFDLPVLIPASPPALSKQSMSDTPLAQENEIQLSTQLSNHPQVEEPAAQPTDTAIIQPAKAFQPLAPAPILNRPTTALLPPPIPNQKPLPQFRPPRPATRSTTSTSLTGNARRSPLQKSLTTVLAGARDPPTTHITLARSESDGGAEMSALVQQDYDESGPWSREAFDLFGWTPDVPKGKVLGPVASRGCGCRAAAEAKTALAEEA